MTRLKKTLAIVSAVAALGAAGCTTPYNNEPVAGAGNYPQYPQYPERVRYGYVESVDALPAERASTGVGAIGGAVAGGMLGNQVGGGSGRTAATIGGAVAGAVIGNEVEKRVRDNRTAALYRFRVRMDDGSYQTFEQEVHHGIRAGDRVRVENGNIFAL